MGSILIFDQFFFSKIKGASLGACLSSRLCGLQKANCNNHDKFKQKSVVHLGFFFNFVDNNVDNFRYSVKVPYLESP